MCFSAIFMHICRIIGLSRNIVKFLRANTPVTSYSHGADFQMGVKVDLASLPANRGLFVFTFYFKYKLIIFKYYKKINVSVL